MFNCASCNVECSDGVTCTVCKQQYDFPCSGITEGGYRRLGDRKATWRCPKCKNTASTASPKPNTQLCSPASDQLTLESVQEALRGIKEQLAPLVSLAEDVKTIKVELANLQSSFSMANDTITKFSESVTILQDRVKIVEGATNVIPTLQAEVSTITNNYRENEQRNRVNNVEIKGIPIKHKENLFEIAIKIGSLIKLPIKKEDINFITRVSSRQSSTEKSIIMSFINRYTKEDFLASARNFKTITLQQLGFSTEGSVYVNDHLTLYNKTLLTKAKSLAKDSNFHFIWVKHCKILARKSATSKTFAIQTEKDLLKIC